MTESVKEFYVIAAILYYPITHQNTTLEMSIEIRKNPEPTIANRTNTGIQEGSVIEISFSMVVSVTCSIRNLLEVC